MCCLISKLYKSSCLTCAPPPPPPQMIECLKEQKKQLSPRCHQKIFRLQEGEMNDPELDYQLMRVCKQMIKVKNIRINNTEMQTIVVFHLNGPQSRFDYERTSKHPCSVSAPRPTPGTFFSVWNRTKTVSWWIQSANRWLQRGRSHRTRVLLSTHTTVIMKYFV